MFRRSTINSEEFIFYVDLEKQFLKKKILIKGISNFVKEKEKFNSSPSYGIILFQTKDNPITTYDEVDSDVITNIIDEKWEERETAKSYFENGLFEALSYVFRKSREARKNYRVIVITDTPSTLSEEYHNALYDLLIKARYFNTFIDIIRVGEAKFYEDDVKLKVITSETHGGVFYCYEPKLFQEILLSLVQNKSEFTVINPDGQTPIQEEDKIFYEKLAVDLISLDQDDEEICDICQREMCPICEAYSDEVHKCYNCNAKYHACCAAQYSIANPVGFKHLFRCIKCDTLLKLEEEFVELIYQEEHEELMEPTEVSSLEETTQPTEPEYEEPEYEEPEYEEPDIVNELTSKTESSRTIESTKIIEELKIELPKPRKPPSLRSSPPVNEEFQEKKVKVGGYFGQEITVKSKLDNNKPSEAVAFMTGGTQESRSPISITALKPPKKTTIKLCKICGATLSNVHICPTCGAKVD